MDIAELQKRLARWEDLHTEFKERIDSPDELAKDLVCFANTDGGQMNWGLLLNGHPTIAGIVLFGRETQRHLPLAQINAARIPGTDVAADPLDRKDLTGRLLDVIDEARRFLYLHLRIPHEIRGFQPEAKPELPVWRSTHRENLPTPSRRKPCGPECTWCATRGSTRGCRTRAW